jgi:ribonucleoside-diphosphate reductase alpha chain
MSPKYGPKTAFSDQLHATKYREEGEDFTQSMMRVADALKDSEEHGLEFRDILLNQRFLPGGRVQAAMGSKKVVTASNCYMSPNFEDSLVSGDNSIMNVLTKAAETSRMGGGIGFNFGEIRPKGDMIKKLGSPASGPVSFMGLFDALCKTISSAGMRRGALLACLPVWHPDIEEFVTVKNDLTKLTSFNVSVGVTDDFMRAVEVDGLFALTFNGKVHKTIRAKDLWAKIMESTWNFAEPGVLFLDTINRKNNLRGKEIIHSSNPCVIGSTKILTRTGWKEIESVVGQTIDVWNGKMWSNVTIRRTAENAELMRVTLSNGRSLTCTPYHRFPVAAMDHETSTHMRLNRILNTECRDLVLLDKISVADWPIITSGGDADIAYQQGFFSGDGHVHNQPSQAAESTHVSSCDYVSLFGEKKKLLPHFTYLSIAEYPVSGSFEGTDHGNTMLSLRCGKAFHQSKKFVPDVTWSVRSRLDWLAGILDADGYAYIGEDKSTTIELWQKDRDFLHRAALMLNTLGVSCGVAVGKGDCHRLYLNANTLQKLRSLGFAPRRLKINDHEPARTSCSFVRVTGLEILEDKADVFCFTDAIHGTGVFDGIYTYNCGEQPLPENGACLLGSFNLPKYVVSGRLRIAELLLDVPAVVRGMDNIIDRSIYPLPEQLTEAKNKRRMGLGITGTANAIEAEGHVYGSPGFVQRLDEILSALTNAIYQASARLAAEKGSFPL